MRLNIKLAATVAALAFVSAGVASAQQGEYIVSSEVISDEVVGGSQYVGDLSSGSGASYEGEVIDGGVVTDGAYSAGGRRYGQPNLFQNQYTQGQANGVNAQMYLSPVPVPPHVGHTYYTYQPFMPHEMLYRHTDRFHNYYDNGRGMNRTKVHYSRSVGQAATNFYWNVLRIPR